MLKYALKYKNLSKKSGIRKYEPMPDFILIEFKDGSKYIYSEKLKTLKRLAKSGKRLNTFINKNLHDRYIKKI